MPVVFKKFEKRHHFLSPLPLVRLGKQVLPSGLLTSFNVLVRIFVHCHLPVYLDNFKVIADDPVTSLIFPQRPMVAFRRDDNLRTSLVHTTEKQATTRAGTYPCEHPRCRTCGHISSETDLLGPKDRFTIKDSFTCLSSGLIYCVSCRRCSAIYIGKTGRTLRERFGEHLRSINKSAPGFPVTEHFSSNGHAMPTLWSVGSNSAMGTNRGRGRKCVSSFDSGHASCAASIFTSFEVHARMQNANFKCKFITWNCGATQRTFH